MKKLLFLLLVTGSSFAQQQVFNVQKYCIDEKPFAANDCDVLGNEYSFVFLEPDEKEVVFFLTDVKFTYKILDIKTLPESTVYKLSAGKEEVEMRLNKARTKMEFLGPDRRITLTVGKSTKL